MHCAVKRVFFILTLFVNCDRSQTVLLDSVLLHQKFIICEQSQMIMKMSQVVSSVVVTEQCQVIEDVDAWYILRVWYALYQNHGISQRFVVTPPPPPSFHHNTQGQILKFSKKDPLSPNKRIQQHFQNPKRGTPQTYLAFKRTSFKPVEISFRLLPFKLIQNDTLQPANQTTILFKIVHERPTSGSKFP